MSEKSDNTNTDNKLDTLRAQVDVVTAAVLLPHLLPHQRRGALLILATTTDLLLVAQAIANDQAIFIKELLDRGVLHKPSLAEMADWCIEPNLRFQFLIVQPFVLAQPLEAKTNVEQEPAETA